MHHQYDYESLCFLLGIVDRNISIENVDHVYLRSGLSVSTIVAARERTSYGVSILLSAVE